MRHDAQTLLRHILEAADNIADFLSGVEFDAYLNSELLRSAVERKFEIIGETTKLLSETAREIANRIRQRPTLIAFRNVLIHGYSVVDDKRVYLAAKGSLPELRADVATLLIELDKR